MGDGSESIAASGCESEDNGRGSYKAHYVSVSRRKIAAFQRARWAKLKAQQKKAA